jgi:hypothetical protein
MGLDETGFELGWGTGCATRPSQSFDIERVCQRNAVAVCHMQPLDRTYSSKKMFYASKQERIKIYNSEDSLAVTKN